MGVFFRLEGDEPFFLSLKYWPSAGASETTVPTAALLCPLLPYVLLHCRTAALIVFCFCSTYIQRMTPLHSHVLLHCRTALLLFCYISTYMKRMIQQSFVFVRHAGRHQAHFGSTTSTCISFKPTSSKRWRSPLKTGVRAVFEVIRAGVHFSTHCCIDVRHRARPSRLCRGWPPLFSVLVVTGLTKLFFFSNICSVMISAKSYVPEHKTLSQ